MKNINENAFSFRYSKDTIQLFLPMDKQGKEISRSRINNKNLLFFRSGKSFTMQGINTPGSPQRGVIPRSFEVRSKL